MVIVPLNVLQHAPLLVQEVVVRVAVVVLQAVLVFAVEDVVDHVLIIALALVAVVRQSVQLADDVKWKL